LIDKVKPSSRSHLDYYEIAKELIEEHNIISFRGITYVYKDGCYREEDGLINKVIIQNLLKCGLKGKESYTNPTSQIKHIISSLTTEGDYPFNKQPNLIPVKNGVIKFDSHGDVTLVPYSPDYRFTYQFPITFNPGEDTASVLNYLKSTGNDVDFLLQIPAQVILSKWGKVYKKCYLLKGAKNSGKTTFLKMLNTRFFGKENCANIPLQDLINEKHSLSGIVGKVVNIADDLPRIKLDDIGQFKALTGGGIISINRKYHDPFSYENDTTFIFAANDYPPVSQDDPAFWERWILIEFNKAYGIDPTFEERTFTDRFMSAFLKLVIDRMKGIIRSGLMADSYEITRDKWLNGSDPFHQFIHSFIERNPDHYEVSQDVYKQSVIYYKSRGLAPLTSKEFGSKIKAICPSRQRLVGDKKKWCYIGIKIK
jgi:putative DNA primase/helicase